MGTAAGGCEIRLHILGTFKRVVTVRDEVEVFGVLGGIFRRR